MVSLLDRLKNVGNVLSIAANPLSKGKIESSIKTPVLKAGAEFIANNPYTTAGLIAGGKGLITKGLAFASTKVKVLVSGLGLLSAPALIANPNLAAPVINTVSYITPERIAETSYGVGKLSLNPSIEGFKDFISENKNTLITGGIIGAGLTAFVAGKAGASSFFNYLATEENSDLLRKGNDLVKEQIKQQEEQNNKPNVTTSPSDNALPKMEMSKPKETPMPSTVPVPIEPTISPITTKATVKGITKKRRKSYRCCSKPKTINRSYVNLRLNVKSTKSGVCIC